MINILRTDSDNQDFIKMVNQLDADLAERDGSDHSFYAQFNKIDKIKYVVLAYENGQPVGCGAIKEYAPNTLEIKRMYTSLQARGSGIASKVLSELEVWAAELSYEKCVLETGKRQPEAIGLYEKNGYKLIPNYGQYAEIENSLCFEKNIKEQGDQAMKSKSVNDSLFRQASAFVPLAMSLAALTLVLGHAAVFGVVHEADEGAAAHIWQILMVIQLPIAAYFIFKWLPQRPGEALKVLALLAATWLANFAGVYWLT